MGTKSRERIYGSSVRMATDAAKRARVAADKLALRSLDQANVGLQGSAQPSPTLGDALNAGYGYLVRCLGCDTHQTVALDIAIWSRFVRPRFRQQSVLRRGGRGNGSW
jgi:hypothetical protein